jgi:molybdopterin-containing oxidoreductase family membrane subunit
MSKVYKFNNKDTFLEKLEELVKSGVNPEKIDVLTPFHVHEVEHILHQKDSPLKFFTLFGALLGLLAGFAFTIWTILDWPLIVSGKPLVSITPYVVIAFELTILLGGIISLIGFLILGKFPTWKNITDPVEHDNQFVIIEEDGE